MTTNSGQRLEQEQRMTQRLGRQQVRFVRLLELSDREVAQDVRRELDENPALEPAGESAEEFLQSAQDDSASLPDDAPLPVVSPMTGTTRRGAFIAPADASESLYDFLLRQLYTMNLDKEVRRTARYIIGNLDNNGYLRRAPQAMVDDMYVVDGYEPTAEEMHQALRVVQSLDPAGVGAEDLRRSLELQLERLAPSQARTDALNIITNHFELLASARFSRIEALLNHDAARSREALALIRSLNPKPGAVFGGAEDSANYIEPDFIVGVDGDRISISMAGNVPELALSASFEQAVADMNRRKGRRDSFVISRYNDAREYMRILERRQQTLMDVMAAIVELQKPYFLSRGDESQLRPMALRDVGEKSGLDLSVISRATKNKYVSVPWATLPLRFFFSESFVSNPTADGEGAEVSGRGVEQAIRNAVEEEDKRHPLSDDAICEILNKRGYNVSRRTVSKYRKRLGIPVARYRTER